MTVSTHDDRAALAGSTGINSTDPASEGETSPLVDPGTNAGQDGTPKRRGRKPGKANTAPARPVVILCARCNHVIAGSGAGFAYVDLRTAATAMADTSAPKAAWTLAHRGCATHALAPMSPYFVLWTEDIGTVDALLDAMAALSAQRWFAATAWGSLARGILADTETANTRSEINTARNERLAERRRNQRRDARTEGLADDDERHGTLVAYDHWKCRCDRCKAAKSQKRQSQRLARIDR